MLTGKLVRVRSSKDRLIAQYIDPHDPRLLDIAGRMLDMYRTFAGRTRTEIEDEMREAFGDNPTHLVEQGLAKLLEDRCEFEVDSEIDPAEVRDQAFLLAASARKAGEGFDRAAILDQVAAGLSSNRETVDRGLFADLKSEQRLMSFQDVTAEQLLHRYNVALVQAILLRSSGIIIRVSGETAGRYRQLIRKIKFHHLICEIRGEGRDTYVLRLDGPLSLFSSTSKYGLQLANFLPSLLQCQRFEAAATVKWGADRKEKSFTLSHADGLTPATADTADYVPKELQMFVDSFRKSIGDWELSTDAEIVPLPSGHWAPDFQLIHKRSKGVVYVEALGFWRKTDTEKLRRRLASELKTPFLLAVSEQYNIDEKADPSEIGNVYRFKRTMLPNEVARLAAALLK